MFESLCEYKGLFGEPGTGLHSYRIMNIAVVDVLSTLILAFVIHQFILEGLLDIHWISIWWVILGCFILGIISHRLFCVRTTIDKLLFSSSQ
jgi:hypothetical protein